MNTNENYFNEVSGHTEFLYDRKIWRDSLKNDKELLEHAKLMQIDLDRHRYTYHWDWMGVPIIKIPDDIMVIQEFYFSYKPTAVVEIGVARGGGMALASSMQMLIGVELNILGVDLKIFEHTHEILRKFGMKGMKLIECDSTSVESEQAIASHVLGHSRVFVTLDSDHSHDHVLRELNLMEKILPVGSIVLVADTILENFVSGNTNRNWGPGNSPGSALKFFLANNSNWALMHEWSERAVFTESRGGWITKIS